MDEQLHKVILELSLAGYWDWNIRDNTQYFSPRFKSMFGYEENELPNSPLTWRYLLFPEDIENALKSFHDYIKSNSKESYITEARYKHKNGSEVWVICSGKIIEWDDEGNPIRMIGAHTDITKQKEAEISLKISETRFKGAFEHSAIGMALVSITGEFLKVNKLFSSIVGYTEKELKKMSFQDITYPDDLEKDLSNLHKLLNNKIKSYTMEKRYINRENNIIWVKLSVSLVRDNEKKPIHFVSQIEDITEKKIFEENLKLKNELLSVLTSNIPGSIHQYHYIDKFKSKIPFSTESIWDIFEVTPEEVKEDAYKIFERTYEDDKKGLIESFEKSVKELKEWHYEYRVNLPSKGIRWIRVNSKPIKQKDESIIYHSYVTDITEKKNEEVSKVWTHVLDGFGDGYWEFDLKSKKSIVSYDWMKKLGYESSDLLYEEALGMMDEKELKEMKCKIDKLISGDIEIYINEQKVYKKDKNYLWALAKGKLIKDENNKPLKIVGTITDITKQKEKELELQETISIVSEQNNRLLNFAHIVSHNLKNHTSNIQMLLNLIDLSDTEEEKNDIIKMLKTSSSSLTQTILHLNEVVSIQTNINQQKESLNLNQYIQQSLDTLSSQIEIYGIIIHNKVSENLFIHFNPAYLESILLNITSNAIKYRSNNHQCIVYFNAYENNNYIILEISDNGLGIDLDKYGKKLFGMYKTFHNNPDSRGIGLFITKNQIESLSGKIEVTSKVGVGTTFRIYFSKK